MNKVIIILLVFIVSVTGTCQTVGTGVDGEGKVKNIVLLIGDGMGVAQVYAGLTAGKGYLNIAECRQIGFSKTYPADGYITDSGAAGTAIATGYKTYNHAIGVDKDTIPRKSILEYAKDGNKSTGMVVTCEVTHATPASFVAHQKDRKMNEAIAADYLETEVDVFIGGGRDFFQNREDQADLTEILLKKEYQLVFQIEDLDRIEAGRVAGLLYPKAPPRWSDGRGDMLPRSVKKALQLLANDEDGFFLMVEGSQIDWGAHENNTGYLLEELLDFDQAVGEVLDFARKDGNTLVIITADHETGGMGLTGGDLSSGEVQAKYCSSNHTGVMVPVFSFGPGSHDFTGIFENTDLFIKMMNAFGFVTFNDPQ
jgi:alkaline phosphatase